VDATRTAKCIAHYERGTITAPELANWIVYQLVLDLALDTHFLSSIESLPNPVRDEFFDLLRKINDAGFRWSPFLIGPARLPRDPTQHSARLRQIYTALGLIPPLADD
jgi:hypothetical protein